jgi:prepilin peptidase CpaA
MFDLEPSPLRHIVLGVLGLVACVYDLRWRLLPDWLTLGGMALGLILGGVTGGWNGALWAGAGMMCGLGVFWLLWTLGMLGSGDVLFMGACGALLGWPLVIYGLLYTTLAGLVLGLAFSLVRGNLLRVFKNLWTAVASTFNPRKRRVPLAELPTDELPYAVAIALGSGWAALLPYWPALKIIG